MGLGWDKRDREGYTQYKQKFWKDRFYCGCRKKTSNKWQLTNIASNVGIKQGFGLLRSTSPNSSSLGHVSDGFLPSCLSFSSSFARSSLLTWSLSRCPSIFLELHSKLPGFNILGMNHGLVPDESLFSRGCSSSSLATFSFWFMSSSQNTSLSKYCFL